MTTKNNPGKFDCYTLAHPDEPIFTLLGRDKDAAVVVKMWAFLRLQQIELGLRPQSDRAQVTEAFMCATEMEIWNKAYQSKRAMSEMLFDQHGVPIEKPMLRVTELSTELELETKE